VRWTGILGHMDQSITQLEIFVTFSSSNLRWTSNNNGLNDHKRGVGVRYETFEYRTVCMRMPERVKCESWVMCWLSLG
jgi:hypothetical protein